MILEHPWQHVRVRFLETYQLPNSQKIYYRLNVTDIRRFIEWMDESHPSISFEARHQKIEVCERYEKGEYSRGRPIVRDFITIYGSPDDIMVFKLACPFDQ